MALIVPADQKPQSHLRHANGEYSKAQYKHTANTMYIMLSKD